MTIEARQAIVQRYYHEIWNNCNLALFDELMAPEYQNIDPATLNGVVYGREGFRELVTGITISRFSDNLIVEDVVNRDTFGLLIQCGLLPQLESATA